MGNSFNAIGNVTNKPMGFGKNIFSLGSTNTPYKATGGYAANPGYQNMMQNLYGNVQNIGQRTTQQGSFNLGQIPFWRYLAQRLYAGK